MQAVTRVNVEQTSKRAMRKPTRLRYGKVAIAGEENDRCSQWFRRGSGDGMHVEGR